VAEPQVESKEQPVTPITGTEYYIDLHSFSSVFLQNSITEHSTWLDHQTDTIIEGLESGDPEALKQAEAFRKTYSERIAADGKKLISTFQTYSEKRAKKNAKLKQVGFCGNVAELGGCSGEDVTDEMVESLKLDRKFLKMISKAGF
jgi:hypothetical protein